MKRFIAAAALGLFALVAHATELGISAKEAYEKVRQPNAKILFLTCATRSRSCSSALPTWCMPTFPT